MLKLFSTLCITMLLSTTSVFAQGYIEKLIPEAKMVGQGRFSALVWNIYDAALYTSDGQWKKEEPFALSLTYLRYLNGKKIADRSIQEIRKQGFSDEIKLATWHAQMRQIFPDVSEGVVLTGIRTKEGVSIFYKNGQEIGRINDSEFSRHFFDIWLSEKTSAPDLRRKLLGIL